MIMNNLILSKARYLAVFRCVQFAAFPLILIICEIYGPVTKESEKLVSHFSYYNKNNRQGYSACRALINLLLCRATER